jgi:hypothetical protein
VCERRSSVLGGATDITPALFSSPAFFALCGAVLGALLAIGAQASVRRVTPEDPFGGMVQAAAVNFFIMLIAFGSLMAVFVFARSGMLAFGAALVFGFLVAAVAWFLGAARTQNAH